jgi:hypothetical protein
MAGVIESWLAALHELVKNARNISIYDLSFRPCLVVF